jgi:ArsR family transcriptional regulator
MINYLQENNIFKALAESIRLRIILLLTEGELCVCDLTELLSLPQSTVSRHMSRLKNAGLITDRRVGKWVHYTINKETYEDLPSLFETVNSFKVKEPYKTDLINLQNHLKEKKAQINQGLSNECR